MNEAFFDEPNPLVWSGIEHSTEDAGWGDGLVALVLGCGVVIACGMAASLIAIAYELGRIS